MFFLSGGGFLLFVYLLFVDILSGTVRLRPDSLACEAFHPLCGVPGEAVRFFFAACLSLPPILKIRLVPWGGGCL